MQQLCGSGWIMAMVLSRYVVSDSCRESFMCSFRDIFSFQVILQADLCASGSIQKVLSGKHYNRCLSVMKTLFEALHHLLMQQFEMWQGKRTA